MATDTLDKKHSAAGTENGSWDGAEYPFKVGYGKLMIWYFLLSDAFTFAGFLIAYGTLRFSTITWPVPDFVFSTFPILGANHPLLFVTLMTFVLLFSSFTMIRAVQEGHRENRKGVVIWMSLTILGGCGFLGCQAWEWTTLIGEENMSVTTNPFGTHIESGIYLDAAGKESEETFKPGKSYILHKASFESAPAGEGHESSNGNNGAEHETQAGNHEGHASYAAPGDYPNAVVDARGYIHRKYLVASGPDAGLIKSDPFGPKAFGALFFFITGFHGFHVFSGVIFLAIIMINVISGIYVQRRNKNEMVEKIGLYWHFVDLVWVFVFLVFYLL